MQDLILAVAAAFVGIFIGFFLRGVWGKAEKAQLERRGQELAEELAVVRTELVKTQVESAVRAGFESLASERERTIYQLTAERENQRRELQVRAQAESESAARVSKLEAELRGERAGLQEKLALLDNAKQSLANQFEALAGEILEKKSKSFSEGSQRDLGTLLDPLKIQIKEFRDKVEQAQSDSKTGVARLEGLIGNLGNLNQQLAEEAHNLTTALRGSAKAQGDWGEFILRDLLEKAGLREGEQYSFQQRFTELGEEDTRRSAITDVIIKLPGGRHLIVDSKVSLGAYTDWVNFQSEDDRESAMKRHLSSVRSHVNDLASKGYQELSSLETLDFVVMFVPVEPAFFAAIKADDRLWSDAYKQKVLLVGPTTLLFVIRIVHELWDQEVKAQNYREVMDRGSKLYDKFVGFLKDLDGIGDGLANASQSFEEARKKLTRSDTSLVRQVERLRTLGVTPKVKKSRSKDAVHAVIPERWLDGSVADKRGLLIAASAELEEDEGEDLGVDEDPSIAP